jgi:hypothetical protein
MNNERWGMKISRIIMIPEEIQLNYGIGRRKEFKGSKDQKMHAFCCVSVGLCLFTVLLCNVV